MKITSNSKISIFFILFFFVGSAGLGDNSISLTVAQLNNTVELDNKLAYENPNIGSSLEYPADLPKDGNITIKSPRPSNNQPTSSP